MLMVELHKGEGSADYIRTNTIAGSLFKWTYIYLYIYKHNICFTLLCPMGQVVWSAVGLVGLEIAISFGWTIISVSFLNKSL